MRQRCYRCFRPQPLCFCESIPQINNRTDVLILQHVAERFHPFNTARIVRESLQNCRLIAADNRRLGACDLPLRPDAGLLYPDAKGRCLSDLPAAAQPGQLVIVDGTWHQAKTIVRDVPQLQGLPRFRLAPESPGQYRIRREPTKQSLSTLEATVSALRVLEPETAGLDRLLAAFDAMIDGQLAHAGSHAAWRQNRKRQSRPRHLPQRLLQHADRLIVAYGEAMPAPRGQQTTASPPISWVAQRMGLPQRFACLVRPPQPLSDTALQHLQLSRSDFDHAVSVDEFRRRWSRFLRPGDVLAVYHQRTARLLQNIDAVQPPCLVLKSVFGKWQTGFHSIEELLASEAVKLSLDVFASRAQQRLEMAVALVEQLRNRYAQRP